MTSLNTLPVDVKILIMRQLSDDDFYRLSLVSSDWYHACCVHKFPIEEVSLDTMNTHEKQLNVSIYDRGIYGPITTVVFEQVDPHTAISYYLQPGGGYDNTDVYQTEDDQAFRQIAVDYFFRILRSYRVAKVHVELFHRPELLPLLTERTNNFRYKCESFSVTEATYEQIYVLSRAFHAHDYNLQLASHLKEQPMPLHRNIIGCYGKLTTQGLVTSKHISLFECHSLKTKAECSIDLSVLEKWAVKREKRLVDMSRVKIDTEQLKSLVERHRKNFSLTNLDDPLGGPAHALLSFSFLDSQSGESSILEILDERTNDSRYEVRLVLVNSSL